MTTTENFNPIIDSIASNSSKKIKYFVKKLSYKNNKVLIMMICLIHYMI